MKLEDCTKEELIYFICNECFFDKNTLAYHVGRFRHDREFKKYQEAIKVSKEALEEYFLISKPYNGCNWSDIPMHVLKKLAELESKHKKYSAIAERHYKKSQKALEVKQRGACK